MGAVQEERQRVSEAKSETNAVTGQLELKLRTIRDCLTRGKHKQDKTLVTTKPVMGSLAKPGTVSIVPRPKVEDIELEHDHDDCKQSLNHCIAAGQSTRACFHDYRDCLTRGKHKQDKTLVTTKPVMGSLAKPGTVSIVPLPKVEDIELEHD